MGGFGAPDRGGSRESKNSSLRANKKNAADAKKNEAKTKVNRPTISDAPPAALPPQPDLQCAALVDAAAQLASRQFDRDQLKVLQRATSSGVGPIITYTTDDSKLEALVRSAKENAGQVYCMLGVHSDNIKRANDRLAPARLEQLRELALEGCCVAVLGGLAFRDVGIRYAQERALAEQMELAAVVALPLVLYEVRAAEALVERIAEFRASGAGEGRAACTPIAIYNFAGSEEELATYLGLGCHIVLTGRVCDQTEKGERLRELASTIPPDRLMLASDSPFATPQNIDDVFVREGRNEPSNLPYVLKALAAALGVAEAELAATTRRNTLTFFGIREASEVEAAEAVGEAVGEAVMEASGNAVAAASVSREPDAAAAGAAAGPSSSGQAQSSKGLTTAATTAATAQQGKQQKNRGRGGGWNAARRDEEEEEEEEGDEGEGQAKGRRGGKAAAGGKRAAGKAANLFAQLQLQEEGNEEAEEQGGTGGSDGSGGNDEEDDDGDGAASRGGGGVDASTSAQPNGHKGRSGRPAPRNFVAEYEAAAAAKGPAAGPRVSYACRGCRSVLFTEADVEAHQGEERALFAATKPRNNKGRGKKAADDSEGGLCSMHFLRKPLAWMETCLQADGPGLGEGKLVCPTCSAKLGKWAAGGGGGTGGGGGGGKGGGGGGGGSGTDLPGVQCSCGVMVAAPTYAVLRARLDIQDSQLDIASAVQSTLKAYEEEEGAASGSSSDEDGGGGTRKKRQKQKRNKTANFSSFRNKNFGVSMKQQKQTAENVAGGGAGGMGAVMEQEGGQ